MKNQTDYNEKRFKELSERAERTGKYYFTDFLTIQESSLLQSLSIHNFTLYGGCEGCERVVACFGDYNSLGYKADFPITCIKINLPVSGPKPALSHRDFLGALMGLGIERCVIGDICITENSSYVFVCTRISDYILQRLITVGKYTVNCEMSEFSNDIVLVNTKETEVNIASYRCDCVISAVYNMSRTKSESYFSREQVFINGKMCTKSTTLKIGDTVTVRHKGKFRILEECGYSKKGRIYIRVYMFN